MASDLLDGLQSLGLLRLLVLVLFGPIRFALLPLGKPLLVTGLLVTGFPANQYLNIKTRSRCVK